jgi:hypothetical protein
MCNPALICIKRKNDLLLDLIKKILLLVSLLFVAGGFALGQSRQYFITGHVNSPDKARYYDGDTIYVAQRNGQVRLTFFGESDSAISKGLRWRYGTTNGTSGATLTLRLDSVGHIPVNVYRTDTLLMAITLAVYQMPVFYFQPGYDYDGEYGFDDSTHQYLHIRNNPQFAYGYQVRKMPGDTAYFVPWMSLLHGQEATIRYHIKQWSGLAQLDRKGYLELRPEAGSHIRINGAASARFYFHKLKAHGSLDIGAMQWVAAPDSLRMAGDYQAIVKGVYVITHTGDTVGKLNLSCAKPEMKQVVFVYVNIGRGYDSSVLNRTNMLRQLNQHSHNQLMRQWVLNTDFPDTLDLTAEYFANPRLFNADTMPELLKALYLAKTGINLDAVNRYRGSAKSANYIRFAFITHFFYPKLFNFRGYPWIRWLNGITAANDTYAAMFETANLKTVCHEFGHMLKHDHTHDKPYNIHGKATHNVMDYSITGFQTIFNRFWYAQWIKTF